MLVSTQVRDVMTRDVVTVPVGASVVGIAGRLHDRGVGSVVVVDDGPVGIVTDGDVVGLVAEGRDLQSLTAAEVMTPSPATIPADAPIDDAATALRERGVKQLPVLEDGTMVGIVTVTDLSYFLPQFALRQEPPVPEAEADWEFDYRDEATAGVSPGDVVRFSKRIDESDVRRFATVSGDTNPLHLDDSFAAESRFGRRIVHGSLVASTISAALSRLPGLIIYLGQDLRFQEPVDVGEQVTAVCEVADEVGRGRYRLRTEVVDADDATVVAGEAVVLVDPRPDVETDVESGAGAGVEEGRASGSEADSEAEVGGERS
jgi:acyl dehydratase/CBS domain-containing protein